MPGIGGVVGSEDLQTGGPEEAEAVNRSLPVLKCIDCLGVGVCDTRERAPKRPGESQNSPYHQGCQS